MNQNCNHVDCLTVFFDYATLLNIQIFIKEMRGIHE